MSLFSKEEDKLTGLVFNTEHDNDPRNLLYEDIAPLAGGRIPDDFSLPESWTLNQGKTSSCTCHAAVHALFFQTGKMLSPRYIFKRIKTESKFPSSKLGYGAYMRDAVAAALEGTPTIEILPNTATTSDAEYIKFDITEGINASARRSEGGTYLYVASQTKSNLDRFYAVQRYIWEQRKPVIIGIEWRSSFNKYKKIGIIPVTAPSGSSTGHAILAIGWKLIDQHLYLICENSWGDEWGDQGKIYLPLGFFSMSSAIAINPTSVPMPKPRQERNVNLEKANADILRRTIYEKFDVSDPARALAGRLWLILVPALTYYKWTITDIINGLYAKSRNKVGTKAYNFNFEEIK